MSELSSKVGEKLQGVSNLEKTPSFNACQHSIHFQFLFQVSRFHGAAHPKPTRKNVSWSILFRFVTAPIPYATVTMGR